MYIARLSARPILQKEKVLNDYMALCSRTLMKILNSDYLEIYNQSWTVFQNAAC